MTYNELDDCVIEPFVLLIPGSLDHLEQVVDEMIVELGQLLFIKLLHPAHLVHEICCW
jgi:hypothetical protein